MTSCVKSTMDTIQQTSDGADRQKGNIAKVGTLFEVREGHLIDCDLNSARWKMKFGKSITRIGVNGKTKELHSHTDHSSKQHAQAVRTIAFVVTGDALTLSILSQVSVQVDMNQHG